MKFKGSSTKPKARHTPVERVFTLPALYVVPPRSRSTREGPPDVHHPQTGRPVFPGPQRGERIVHPFPGIVSARPSFLHHCHTTGAPQPGDERGGHHTGEAGHRRPGAAHPEGNQGRIFKNLTLNIFNLKFSSFFHLFCLISPRLSPITNVA